MAYNVYDECDLFELSVGDMVIDSITGATGILTGTRKVLSDVGEDMTLWTIFWSNTVCDGISYKGQTQMEELGLKMSIVIGIYDLHVRQVCSADVVEEKI